MPNMTLAIPIELKRKMGQFKEINWSEVARQAIWEKTLTLEEMNRLLSKSKLTQADVARHATIVSQRVLGRHKAG